MKRLVCKLLSVFLLICSLSISSCSVNKTNASTENLIDDVPNEQSEPAVISDTSAAVKTESTSTTASQTFSMSTTTPPIAESLSYSEIVTSVSTVAETKTTYPGEYEFSLGKEYYGAAGELLNIPPESEWKSLVEIYGEGVYNSDEIAAGFYSDVNWVYFDDYSIVRYPTGVYYDTERTPELYANGTFIGKEFYDYDANEWIKAELGDSFGNLMISNAKVNYFYGRLLDEFIWSSISICFEGETILEGIIYMNAWETGLDENEIIYYFTPYPDSLFEQSFPMLKETACTYGYSGSDGYCMGGDTMDIILTKNAISESAMNELNEFGYCKIRGKLSNVKITGAREHLNRGYCFADLIDFDVSN